MSDHTPLMAQYREIKARHDDCVLLFRVGDFYETFYDDAVDVARILNIALTTRDKKKKNPIPLAGVPFHAAENYISRLLAAGRKVAVCEQVEDPAQAKGIVQREVVEILTPGTSMQSQGLDERENNFCLAVHLDGTHVGVALIDVSTGDLLSGEGDISRVQHLLQGKRVREVVCRRGVDRKLISSICEGLGRPYVGEVDAELFSGAAAEAAIEKQFDGTGDTRQASLGDLERIAVGALLGHCHSLRSGPLPQVASIARLGGVSFLSLDDETIRNLELFEPLAGGDPKATLVKLLDGTYTPMGGRELRMWMQKPLCDAGLIGERLDAVGEFYGDVAFHERVATHLRGIYDIQRLASRIAARKAIPRELHALRESLERLPELVEMLSTRSAVMLERLRGRLGDHADLARTIEQAIVDEPPGHLREGGVIRRGYAPEVDELIDGSESAKRWIADLERRERERTGIASLKVGFNKVFGYYIEVSKANREQVPTDYIGKQTLVGAERFFTSDLKDREERILENEEKRVAAEQTAFDALCGRVAAAMDSLQVTAQAVAQLDVLQALAATAKRHRFRRPVVDESKVLDIDASRHPVIERLSAEPFVPNDLLLDVDKRQFALITGPNMSGKSTFLRQVALVVILAQMGSFVPADRARIGVVDSIFTRVGASDRLSRGESTFLVEMKEAANILREMTEHSLVLLDEIGRGTSTYDGLSIAWAVTEYLLQGVKARPKTLFATHFHELTQLRGTYPRLVNLKITIKEWEGGVVFLRKIAPGTSDRSYGIHAARVAGMPAQVLKRAEEILHSLELRRDLLRQGVALEDKGQFSLFGTAESASGAAGDAPEPSVDPLHARIRGFDVNRSTPMDALQFVKNLQDELGPDPSS